MKIAFATCVKLGLSCIEEIYRIGGNLDLLISLKDENANSKSGRIYLDDISTKKNVPLLKIDNINDQEVLSALSEYKIDWLFIIGWSQIAKKELLCTPQKGCIGMHPTLLPQGRGRAAIPWAILKELDETGVTMFKLDEGVDTGDIIAQGRISMHSKINATELYEKVNEMHVKLISNYWESIYTNTVKLSVQDESKATFWEGRTPKDGEIKKNMFVKDAEKLVRAITHPYPGAFYKMDDKIMKIWSATISPEKNGENSIKLKDGYLIPENFEII